MPGVRAKGRPKKGWVEVVYNTIRARGQDVEEAKVLVNDRMN